MIVVKKIFMLIVTCDVAIICIVEKYILIKSNHENLFFSNIQNWRWFLQGKWIVIVTCGIFMVICTYKNY